MCIYIELCSLNQFCLYAVFNCSDDDRCDVDNNIKIGCLSYCSLWIVLLGSIYLPPLNYIFKIVLFE